MMNLHRIAAFVLCAAVSGVTPARAANMQHVVFAGGCFWGVQAVFERVKGVTNTVAGYSGGQKSTAQYEMVSSGTTGHAESVDVTYDPSKVSFSQLLDVYFLVAHDPTQLNHQDADEGTQYRSEIFYTTDDQKREVLAKIAQLQHDHAFAAPIVTKVQPLRGFYAAEDYHQHYFDHNPYEPYIMFVDKPKVKRLQERFPQLVRTN
ncbi:MAG: peptide-methionine (S)-S-oxide reductase MsrA [Candidatus Eremiobacteraeota bacterium]|nr:peptide-methionine (S)-S-oxide reductase MsrA [Candidatus Eremiobacteraeota bacterium]